MNTASPSSTPSSSGPASRPLLSGAVRQDGGRRAGELSVDFTLLHGLDPAVALETGRVGARFQVGDDTRLEVDVDELGPLPTTAHGYMQRNGDGSGGVEIDVHSDLVPGHARERAHVAAGWSDRHAGRAEVRMRDGDSSPGADSFECWDDHAASVFRAEMPVGGQPSVAGDAAACVP